MSKIIRFLLKIFRFVTGIAGTLLFTSGMIFYIIQAVNFKNNSLNSIIGYVTKVLSKFTDNYINIFLLPGGLMLAGGVLLFISLLITIYFVTRKTIKAV